MRRVTRNVILVIALVLVGLLALGALPSYLGTGDPYYLTVEPIDGDDSADADSAAAEGPAVDVSDVSERRFPYLTGALASTDGRSDGYQLGPYGVKEWFTHTPFDEVDALSQRVPEAVTDDDRVRIDYEGERYYVDIVQEAA